MKLPRLFILSLLLFAFSGLSRAVTLEWDAPVPPDLTIVGYRLKWGIQSGVPTQETDMGLAFSATIPDSEFSFNVTYYFVAVSYNADGLESVFSNEVAWQRPMPTPTPTPTPTPSPTPKPPENLRIKLTVVNGSGDGTYRVGQQVLVKANPAPRRYTFHRWIGDWVILSNPFLSTTTATIPSLDVAIAAIYRRL
jgi:hypothetical protein